MPRLPAGYRPSDVLEVSSTRVRFGLLLLGLLVATGAAQLMLVSAPLLRSDWHQFIPQLVELMGTLEGGWAWAAVVAAIAAAMALLCAIIIIHELLHAICYWGFSGTAPQFGMGLGYAFCSVRPGVFLSRNAHVVAALAPLASLSALGLLLMAHGPLLTAPIIGVYLVAHAAGAAADVATAAWLLLRPSSSYVWDHKTTLIVYRRGRG